MFVLEKLRNITFHVPSIRQNNDDLISHFLRIDAFKTINGDYFKKYNNIFQTKNWMFSSFLYFVFFSALSLQHMLICDSIISLYYWRVYSQKDLNPLSTILRKSQCFRITILHFINSGKFVVNERCQSIR